MHTIADRARFVLAALAAALLALAIGPAGGTAKPEPKPKPKIKLTANLKGKHVEPGPGDPDGSGKLTLTLRPQNKKNLCYVLDVQGLGGVRQAGVRAGAKRETGPGVVRVFKTAEPVTGEGTTEGCLKTSKPALREIKADPEAHYAEVENAGYPQGALRGQLRKRA